MSAPSPRLPSSSSRYGRAVVSSLDWRAVVGVGELEGVLRDPRAVGVGASDVQVACEHPLAVGPGVAVEVARHVYECIKGRVRSYAMTLRLRLRYHPGRPPRSIAAGVPDRTIREITDANRTGYLSNL